MHDLVVGSIEKNTEEAVLVSLDVPEELKTDFEFKAGQYITVESVIGGEKTRRSYSLCAAPYENRLQVGIKKVVNGVFSNYAFSSLKVGQSLKVNTPEGRFIYDPQSSPSAIAAFAAGSGITPIMSILKTHLNADPENQFNLVYGNKSPKQTMFYEELLALQQKFSSQLKIVWVFSQANVEEALFGRIDKAIVQYYQKQFSEDISSFYLCGPEGMIDAVTVALESNGIASDKIFSELFFSTSENSVSATSEDVALTVTVDDVSKAISSKQNVTLLDAALNAKLDVPYSCQGGVCSSCIARIKTGKATMQTNQILTDREVEEGLILTCQALPQSDQITVDYDDV